MLRISEVTTGEHPIRVWDVHVRQNKNKLLFVLRMSKTHWWDDKPQIIKISSSDSQGEIRFCPFQAVKDYILIRPVALAKTDPFFVFSDRSPVKTVPRS